MITVMQLHLFRMWVNMSTSGSTKLPCQIQYNSSNERMKEKEYQNPKEGIWEF